MKKLFILEATVRTVIAADDFDDALVQADRLAREAISDTGLTDTHVEQEVTSLADLPEKWDGGSLPYGGDGITAIADMLKAAQPA